MRDTRPTTRQSAISTLPDVVIQARRHARASGLIYVTDAEPGIARQRSGNGFRYVGPNGKPIRGARTLQRIRTLAIPPAYTHVWICTKERGHLQATGRDARRRKQYRYHPRWRTTRDNGKFTRMIEFGSRLPQLRRRLKRDLALPDLPKEKVLAVIVTLLDETLIRVGNEEYVRTNSSYGVTTLRDRHARFFRDGKALLCFRGKSRRQHQVALDDRRLIGIIKRCQQLPGQVLFQYVDDERQRQPVDSGMVNDYLREAMDCEGGPHPEGFTAKDFRTWGATVRAIAYLATRACGENVSEREYARCIADTAKDVAPVLGNSPAVCRKSYINPVVFTAWRSQALERLVPKAALSPQRLERLALKLLRTQERGTRSQ